MTKAMMSLYAVIVSLSRVACLPSPTPKMATAKEHFCKPWVRHVPTTYKHKINVLVPSYNVTNPFTIYLMQFSKCKLDSHLKSTVMHSAKGLVLSLCISSEEMINIIQRFGSCQPIMNKWLPGNFWTLLAQWCWWGVVFSNKAYQHSGSKQQWTQHKSECPFR